MTVLDNNIHWHNTLVSHVERESRNGHKSIILWFTGLRTRKSPCHQWTATWCKNVDLRNIAAVTCRPGEWSFTRRRSSQARHLPPTRPPPWHPAGTPAEPIHLPPSPRRRCWPGGGSRQCGAPVARGYEGCHARGTSPNPDRLSHVAPQSRVRCARLQRAAARQKCARGHRALRQQTEPGRISRPGGLLDRLIHVNL